MLTPELQKYITNSRAAGSSDEQIKSSLLAQGWHTEDINTILPDQSKYQLPFSFGQFIGYICLVLDLLMLLVFIVFQFITGSFEAVTDSGSFIGPMLFLYGMTGLPLLVSVVGLFIALFAFKSVYMKWILSILSLLSALAYITLVVTMLGGRSLF